MRCAGIPDPGSKAARQQRLPLADSDQNRQSDRSGRDAAVPLRLPVAHRLPGDGVAGAGLQRAVKRGSHGENRPPVPSGEIRFGNVGRCRRGRPGHAAGGRIDLATKHYPAANCRPATGPGRITGKPDRRETKTSPAGARRSTGGSIGPTAACVRTWSRHRCSAPFCKPTQASGRSCRGASRASAGAAARGSGGRAAPAPARLPAPCGGG